MTTRPEGSALRRLLAHPLVPLVIGQICLHSCFTGVRMAAPLQALRQGHATWAVGLLMGLFALAPIALALHAGRLADRHGYHGPMRAAVALSVGPAWRRLRCCVWPHCSPVPGPTWA
jgi:MFS family permease